MKPKEYRPILANILRDLDVSSTPSPRMLDQIYDKVKKNIERYIELAKSIQKKDRHSTLKVTDLNDALEALGQPKLYGYFCHPNVEYEHYDDLLIPIDRNLDINHILLEDPPPIETDEYFSFHWLSVHGSIPKIPLNEIETTFAQKEDSIKPEEIHWNLEGPIKAGKRKTSVTPSEKSFFDRIFDSFLNGEGPEIFVELENADNIQQLLPFFLKSITDFFAVNKNNSEQMMRLFLLTKSLFFNRFINKNDYSRSFLSIFISLITDHSKFYGKMGFKVRLEAAKVLSKVIEEYEKYFPYIKEKILKEMVNIYQENISYASFEDEEAQIKTSISQTYGSLCAIFYISPFIFERTVIPNTKEAINLFKTRMNTSTREKEDCLELILLYQQLAKQSFDRRNKDNMPPELRKIYEGIFSNKLL